jgi:hypothetical protein
MTQTFEPIETVAGIIFGRDAIYLDDVLFDYQKKILELRGELNSALCSRYKDDEDSFIKYSLTFSRVLAFAMTELDFKDYGTSSFDRVVNSEWLEEMCQKDHSSKVKPNIEHYLVFTYDDVFDVACESFELKILEERGK